jgi:hypothetical protein
MRVCEYSVSTFVLIVDHAGLLIPANEVANVTISLLIMQFVHCKCSEGQVGF